MKIKLISTLCVLLSGIVIFSGLQVGQADAVLLPETSVSQQQVALQTLPSSAQTSLKAVDQVAEGTVDFVGSVNSQSVATEAPAAEDRYKVMYLVDSEMDIVNQDGSQLDIYSDPQSFSKWAWLGTGASPDSSYLGISFAGEQLPSNAKVVNGYVELVNTFPWPWQWIWVSFDAYLESSATPSAWDINNLPSARMLTQNFTSQVTDSKWMQLEPWQIDVTAQLHELTAGTPDGEKLPADINFISRGTGSAWGRKFFARSAPSEYLPRLVVEYELTTPQNNPPVIADIPTQVTDEDVQFPSIDLSEYVSDPGDTLSWEIISSDKNLNVELEATLLKVTPEVNWSGEGLVELQVMDSIGQKDTALVNFQVIPVPDAPEIISSPATKATEGDTYYYQIESVDVDGDVLKYSLLAGPAEMSIEEDSGLVEWDVPFDTLPSYEVEVAVSDGGLTDSQEFILEVIEFNAPPQLLPIPDQVVPEDDQVNLDLSQYLIDPGDTVTWEVIQEPDNFYWMRFSPAGSPNLKADPSHNWNGTATGIIQVTDSAGQKAEASITFVVTPVADGPKIISKPVLEATEGQLYSYQLVVVDVDDANEKFTYELHTTFYPAMIIDENGLITWQLGYEEPEVASYWVVVADSTGLVADQVVDNIQVIDVNIPPQILSVPDQYTQEDAGFAELDISDYVIDPDDTVVLELVSVTGGIRANIDAGVIAVTPEEDWNGVATVVVRATDTIGQTAETSINFVVKSVADAPVITSIPETTVDEGGEYSYSVLAEDADGDFLTYSLVTAPGGMSISVEGEITWILGYDTAGDYTVKVVVSDGKLEAVQEFILRVENVNRSPSTPQLLNPVNNSVDVEILPVLSWTRAIDPDNDFVTYSVLLGTSADDLRVIEDTVFLDSLHLTEPLAYSTGYYWQVIAQDSLGGSAASDIWSFTTMADPNLPPAAYAGEDQVVDEGVQVTLDGSGSVDPDNDALSFLWEQISGPVVELADPYQAISSFTAPFVDTNTTLTFRLSVGDGKTTSTDEVSVLIVDVPAVPAYPANYLDTETLPAEGSPVFSASSWEKLFDNNLVETAFGYLSNNPLRFYMEYDREFTLSGFDMFVLNPSGAYPGTTWRVYAADNMTDLKNASGSYREVMPTTITTTEGWVQLRFPQPVEAKAFMIFCIKQSVGTFMYYSEMIPVGV